MYRIFKTFRTRPEPLSPISQEQEPEPFFDTQIETLQRMLLLHLRMADNFYAKLIWLQVMAQNIQLMEQLLECQQRFIKETEDKHP
jgi:hypothetical protein